MCKHGWQSKLASETKSIEYWCPLIKAASDKNSFGYCFGEWLMLGEHHPSAYMYMMCNQLVLNSVLAVVHVGNRGSTGTNFIRNIKKYIWSQNYHNWCQKIFWPGPVGPQLNREQYIRQFHAHLVIRTFPSVITINTNSWFYYFLSSKFPTNDTKSWNKVLSEISGNLHHTFTHRGRILISI